LTHIIASDPLIERSTPRNVGSGGQHRGRTQSHDAHVRKRQQMVGTSPSKERVDNSTAALVAIASNTHACKYGGKTRGKIVIHK